METDIVRILFILAPENYLEILYII